MVKPKVYVTRQLFPEAIEILETVASVEVFEGVDDAIPRDLLLEKVRDVEGLLPLITERIDGELMDAGERLRVIGNQAVGSNNIDVDAATERGICVINTPGILTDTTADAAFAPLMAVARRIPEADPTSGPGEGFPPRFTGNNRAHGFSYFLRFLRSL